MDPAIPDINISDVVVSTTGRDRDEWFYVIAQDPIFLYLANGKDRTLDRPKRKKRKHVQKVLRSETRVAKAKKRRQSAQQRITKKSGAIPEKCKVMT